MKNLKHADLQGKNYLRDNGLVSVEYDALFSYRCCDCPNHADYGFRGDYR